MLEANGTGIGVTLNDVTPQTYEPRMPPKRAEVIAQRIVKDIRARGLRPGEPLATEADMCASHMVGRSTLREGLRILELLGVVEIVPRTSKAMVSPIRGRNTGPAAVVLIRGLWSDRGAIRNDTRMVSFLGKLQPSSDTIKSIA